MDYKFEGWIGHDREAAKGQMRWGSFEPKIWTEDDVDIKITHCGVCATDVHVLREDWGPTIYPCCVGHEIIGNVVRVGANVKHVRLGDRVGVGPQSGSCERINCHECSSGQSNYCERAVGTYSSEYPNGEGKSYGGYANYNRANGSFVFRIPDGLASEHAAPLLCAGITLYSPLKRYGCGPSRKVGIVGIGGLGHIGILLTKAMGADLVVAMSRTSSKQADAMELGADAYIATAEDTEWSSKNKRTLDLVILTASSPDMPINDYLSVLKVGGTLVQLSAHTGGEFPSFSALPLLFNGVSIAGSINGSPAEMGEMLGLAAAKRLRPWVQTMDMEDANRALVEIEKGSPRFRLVLVNKC